MSAIIVSIVLPVYNGACFLDNALQSIACQTMSSWEVLAVDV